VRDPDGHKIEATYWDEALADKLGIGRGSRYRP
jgi:hypothetical protein